ncbi:hypothetical protein FNV43_RR02227 [Rhamnella rubrinervis]|uniref:F-box domain-containing protein n=1 Tax=Rhamnella rubrinervis TaxID=2594499 RepID=A0A8K0HSC3_9ROSA|nr:hypothetical protein FNV43_RR02227 [Rhamnella rubrinervis]
MVKRSVQQNWSELPKELLQLIFKRLALIIDTVRVRAVCHSWNLAMRSCPVPGAEMTSNFHHAALNGRLSADSSCLRTLVATKITDIVMNWDHREGLRISFYKPGDGNMDS